MILNVYDHASLAKALKSDELCQIYKVFKDILQFFFKYLCECDEKFHQQSPRFEKTEKQMCKS